MMNLLSLKEAADYLGYTVKGLRKIVDRSRENAFGKRTRGPIITFCQASNGSPIKFKQEWLDEFVERHTVIPQKPELKDSKRTTGENTRNNYGFNKSLF